MNVCALSFVHIERGAKVSKEKEKGREVGNR